MAGVAGVLAVELLGQGNWVTAQQWVNTCLLQSFCLNMQNVCYSRMLNLFFCMHQAAKDGTPTYLGVPLPLNFGLVLATVSCENFTQCTQCSAVVLLYVY